MYLFPSLIRPALPSLSTSVEIVLLAHKFDFVPVGRIVKRIDKSYDVALLDAQNV